MRNWYVLRLLSSLLIPHAAYASGYVSPRTTHGYRPHPGAFRRPRKRAPYKGNLGRRH